jgi:hypothetical protein
MAQVCAREEHGVVAPKVRLARHLRLGEAPPAAAAAAALLLLLVLVLVLVLVLAAVEGLDVQHHILHELPAGHHRL